MRVKALKGVAHPRIADLRVPIWRSPDRHVLVQELSCFGIEELEAQSVLQDGTIVRTRWRAVPGPMPAGWVTHDPDGPPPPDDFWIRQRTSSMEAQLAEASVHQPGFGLITRRVDGLPLDAVLAAHGEKVAALVPRAGPPVPMDVALSGAIERRSVDVAQESANLAFMQFLVSLLLLPIMAAVLLTCFALFFAGDPIEVSTRAARLEASKARMAPWLGLSLGLGVGATIAVRGQGRFLPLMWAVLLVLAVGSPWPRFAEQVLRADGVAWTLAGVAIGVFWGKVLHPWVLERMQRSPGTVGGPIPPWPSAARLREAYGARPPAPHLPDEPFGAAPTEGDEILRVAGWERLGTRRAPDPHSDALGETLGATVSVWRSPEGTTMAESRRLVSGGASIELRSIQADGTILETRTLPDPGPLERATVRTARGDVVRTPLVTRWSLALGRLWPTRAVLRVSDRPRVGLRVAHVDGVAEALARHRARLSGTEQRIAGLDDAFALARQTSERRPEPASSARRLALWVLAASAAVTFITVLLDGGPVHPLESWALVTMPVSGSLMFGSLLLMSVPSDVEGWRTAGWRTGLVLLFLIVFYIPSRWNDFDALRVLLLGAGLAGALVGGRIDSARELRRKL